MVTLYITHPIFQMFVFTYRHPKIEGVAAKSSTMSRIRSILAEANFSGEAYPISKEYATWETDQVIFDAIEK